MIIIIYLNTRDVATMDVFFLSTRAELHHDESRDTKTDISIPT
jgi:hypothetical protein